MIIGLLNVWNRHTAQSSSSQDRAVSGTVLPLRLKVHHQKLFRVLRLTTLPAIVEAVIFAVEHVHVFERRQQALVRADLVTLQIYEPVDERLVVDLVHELVVS